MLSDAEAARKLKVARRTVWKWIDQGRIKGRKVKPSEFTGYSPFFGPLGAGRVPGYTAPEYEIEEASLDEFMKGATMAEKSIVIKTEGPVPSELDGRLFQVHLLGGNTIRLYPVLIAAGATEVQCRVIICGERCGLNAEHKGKHIWAGGD